MTLREDIITCIAESDMVLVDTCIFGCTGSTDPRESLGEKLYDTRRISELESLTNNIFSLHESWRWDLHNIVSKENVYTIPEVIEEINQLANILQETYSWHTNRVKQDIKWERESIKERIDLQEQYPIFNYLNALIKDVRRTIHRLNVYQGPTHQLPRNVEGASETDYNLVEAAIGYSISNPEMKVEILSEDRHIQQIVHKYLLNEIAKTMRETDIPLEEALILSRS